MNRAGEIVGAALRAVATAFFIAIAVLMIVQVLNRFYPLGSMDWSDEIIELLLVWTIFCGSAEVWRIRQHFLVDMIPLMLKGTRYERPHRLVTALACLLFIAVFTYQSFDLFMRAVDESPYFSLTRRLWYASMPVNGFLMCLFSLREIYELLLPGRARA